MPSDSTVKVTRADAKLIDEAVASGEYASAADVVHDALQSWRRNQKLGRLWDEGVASGLADLAETIDDIKAEARRRLERKAR